MAIRGQGCLSPMRSCWQSNRRGGIREGLERFLCVDDGVGVDQELAGNGDEYDLRWLCRLRACAWTKSVNALFVPFGAEGTHVKYATQAL